jgi:hypothetical protein
MLGNCVRWGVGGLMALSALVCVARNATTACCYFSAKDKDVQQPAQKVFLTWDPQRQRETFTVQPRFEGDAHDFGMVIPTPSRPKLDEMPRDFFKELAVFTILKNRQVPQSKLLPPPRVPAMGALGIGGIGGFAGGMAAGPGFPPARPPVTVLEAGQVGSLDYKILEADRADALERWLTDHQYHYANGEKTLDFYVRKKWVFTVMKIDPAQMKRDAAGRYTGEVTPTRFQFTTDKPVYPLKITQLSVRDRTEALFYIQAPTKTDLPGDLTYQFQWVPMLQGAQGQFPPRTFGTAQLPGRGDEWLRLTRDDAEGLRKRADELGYPFTSGKRPGPTKDGRTPATLEWAKKLTAADVRVLAGDAPYSETVPDPDAGFTVNDIQDPQKGPLVAQVIRQRLAVYRQRRPGGYLVREAPEADVRQLNVLTGHLQEGQFLTKIRKVFVPAEMDDDLAIVPAKVGSAADRSEYEEILPTSPP